MDFRGSTSMRARSHSIFPNALKRAFAILLMVVVAVTMIAAAPSPAPSKAPGASASPGVTTLPAAQQPDAPAVIGFLSQVIGWYRHLAIEEGLITDPAEMLFVSEDRQMADQVLNLSFEFAKAEAARARLKALQDQLANAGTRKRDDLAPQIAAAQSELDLAEARGEAVHTIQQFESGNFHQETGLTASGLTGQIEELENSVPEAERNAKTAAPTAAAPAPIGGMAGIFEQLLTLSRNSSTLDDTIDVTNALVQQVERMRAPMLDELRDIDTQGDALAKASAGDVGALRARKEAFQKLIERHKLISAAAIP